MKFGALCLAALLGGGVFSSSVAAVRAGPDVSRLPPGAEQQIQRMGAHLGPRSRGFVASEAARIERTGDFSAGELKDHVIHADLGVGGPGDIDLLVQSIMFQVAQDSENDLRDQIAAMKQAQAQKQRLRDQQNALGQERRVGMSQAAALAGALRTPATAFNPRSDPLRSAPVGGVSLDRQIAEDQADLGSMGDLDQQDQMRLQGLMDARSKALETLSNIMKKAADTAGSISQNLK